ncbi:hypothetical protein HanRHA438_Chr15g0683361 [Helianthus annuus]|nr:hypothetical protein HanRHA438_Chr15g0683361 [Helianthus annuus]
MLMQPRMKCYTVAVEHDLRGFYRVKSGTRKEYWCDIGPYIHEIKEREWAENYHRTSQVDFYFGLT